MLLIVFSDSIWNRIAKASVCMSGSQSLLSRVFQDTQRVVSNFTTLWVVGLEVLWIQCGILQSRIVEWAPFQGQSIYSRHRLLCIKHELVFLHIHTRPEVNENAKLPDFLPPLLFYLAENFQNCYIFLKEMEYCCQTPKEYLEALIVGLFLFSFIKIELFK